MKAKFTILLLIIFGFGNAQVTNQGKPLSWKMKLEAIEPIAMPAFDLKTIKKEDAENDKRKDLPWRFGYEFIVDYSLNNSGEWKQLPNGDRVWRIRFTSENAKTLNFLFSDFYMPEGAKVYLYNAEHTDLLGAYDARQNNEEHVLGTWLVKGSDIYIEYYEPAEVAGQGKLEIFKVVHGYRTQENFLKSPDDDLNGSGDCNLDVDCYIDGINDLKEVNKKAVGLIITNNSGFCSGSLVNNTANDGTPYFLTANHCYSNPSQWAFRFNWISPNPVCAGTQNSTNNAPDFYQTVSGATLRARRAGSDFCLVEITADMPAEWDLTYAGWDHSDVAPQSTFGIHHPAGDIMKTCRDVDAPTAYVDDQDAYLWIVGNWELGVTEGGSSGSPLFDNEGRIIGQLFYGGAACNGTVNNGQYDAFGRFGISWDAGNTVSARLKEWLDPLNTGALVLDSYPLAVVYNNDARAAIVSLGQEDCSTQINPVIRITNKGVNTLTTTTINYQVNNGAVQTLAWAGNLTTGQSQEIALGTFTVAPGQNVFNVNIINPNGVADENTADNTADREFDVLVYEVTDVTLVIQTDDYGDETSWVLTNETGQVIYSDTNYDDNTVYTYVFDDLTEGCYTFTIYDEFEDGICCDYGNGSYTLTTGDGTEIYSGGVFGGSEAVTFGLTAPLTTGAAPLQAALKIYPNPSSGIYSVDAPAGSALQYEVYNVLGQRMAKGALKGENKINLNNAANGVYLLKISDAVTGSTASYKLIKE